MVVTSSSDVTANKPGHLCPFRTTQDDAPTPRPEVAVGNDTLKCLVTGLIQACVMVPEDVLARNLLPQSRNDVRYRKN
jgi:hypothetical protein